MYLPTPLRKQDVTDRQTERSRVSRNCRIYQLHLCHHYHQQWISWIDTQLHLMVRLQPWNFGQCGAPFHCHYSEVQSSTEWLHLTGLYLWAKYNCFSFRLLQTNIWCLITLLVIHSNIRNHLQWAIKLLVWATWNRLPACKIELFYRAIFGTIWQYKWMNRVE